MTGRPILVQENRNLIQGLPLTRCVTLEKVIYSFLFPVMPSSIQKEVCYILMSKVSNFV